MPNEASECETALLSNAQQDVQGIVASPPRCGNTLWVVLALLAVQASFGGNTIIVKLALDNSADPVVFSFLRDVGGAIVLLFACW